MDPKELTSKLREASKSFLAESIDVKGGRDPVANLHCARRANYSLFSLNFSDADCEALRPYLFGRKIPRKPGETPVTCLNFSGGEWLKPAELVTMKSLADERIELMHVARSLDADVKIAIDRAHEFWTSLEWSTE